MDSVTGSLRWKAATARNVAVLGLAGLLVWSVAVEVAMPSSLDPDGSCPGAVGIERRYFPPSATCVHPDGRTIDYIPLPETVVLTVLFVVLAGTTTAGLGVLGWRLLRRGRDIGRTKPGRPVLHVLGAAMMGLVTAVVARVAVLIALFTGGPPGGVVVFVAVALSAIGVASALDRAVGPGGSAGSHRRATVLVLAGSAVLLTLIVAGWRDYAEHNTLLGPAWAVAMGGGVFALLAGAQWIRLPGRRGHTRLG
ncbi:hypothetical protein AB8O38_06580 [Saccharomonospora xinjiangensis]|uniref:hypothetical protein n=1 Tax=Saccharomonospora xinjiangensis TaxID=75294 RepID=UPI0035100F44